MAVGWVRVCCFQVTQIYDKWGVGWGGGGGGGGDLLTVAGSGVSSSVAKINQEFYYLVHSSIMNDECVCTHKK